MPKDARGKTSDAIAPITASAPWGPADSGAGASLLAGVARTREEGAAVGAGPSAAAAAAGWTGFGGPEGAKRSIMRAIARLAADARDVQWGASLVTVREPIDRPSGPRISMAAFHVPSLRETAT